MTGGRFQILSLDGGGLRGMFSAAVLARLEEDLDVRVVDHFDLIAGTSTGGIIALGLGLGMSPRDILQFYTDHGPRIFRDRSRLRGVRHLLPWARDAVEVLMRAQSESATKQVRHFLGADQVLRLNPTVPTGALALDKVDADDLIGRAGHESRTASPSFTRCFADHTAPAYVPYYPARKD